MMMINRIFINLTKGLASAKRINEVLTAPVEKDADGVDFVPGDSHIEFENVSFSYLKKSNNIDSLSFKLKKGQTLGIIGATGSGKTTIVNLLLRFYRPDSGKVRIDGKNINTIPRAELYGRFGSALQTDFLMSDTIFENIRFERDISEEEATKAQEASRALFVSGDSALTPSVDVEETSLADGAIDVISLLCLGKMVPSRSEGRRAIEQGGVTVDGEKISDVKATVTAEQLKAGVLVKRGKKSFNKFILK
jgi:ATP-binding cassette subfamily B protein